MKRHIRIAFASLALGCVAVTRLAANDPMTEQLKQYKGAEFDQKFVGMMIEHHEQGIEMARLAQQRAQRAEIKQFAEKTADKQQKDIEELKAMPGGKTSDHHASTTSDTSQHGTSHASTSHDSAGAPTGRTAHDASSHEAMKSETMTKLQSAQGAEFDRAFTDEMINHHNMAIEMAQLAQSRASDSEVKQFAQKSIEAQKKEVAELKGFRRGSSR